MKTQTSETSKFFRIKAHEFFHIFGKNIRSEKYEAVIGFANLAVFWAAADNLLQSFPWIRSLPNFLYTNIG